MWPWGAVAAFTCICVRVSHGITESCVFSVQCTISRCIRILRLTQSQTTPNLPPSPACGKCAILKIVNYALGRSVGKWSKSKTLNSGTLILADELMRKERGKLRLWALFQLQVWINPINESSKAPKQASYPTKFAWGKRRGSEISASISALAALCNLLHCPGKGWHWSIVKRCLKENSDVRTDLDVSVWRVGKLFLPRRAGPTNYTRWCIS